MINVMNILIRDCDTCKVKKVEFCKLCKEEDTKIENNDDLNKNFFVVFIYWIYHILFNSICFFISFYSYLELWTKNIDSITYLTINFFFIDLYLFIFYYITKYIKNRTWKYLRRKYSGKLKSLMGWMQSSLLFTFCMILFVFKII